MAWPFDDLPRSSADIPRIGGDPSVLRTCASDLRTVAADLESPRTAASQLQTITDGTSWNGAGFDAFRDKVDKNPKAADIENAQSVMHQTADVLTTLASGIDDCQSRIDWCRRQIDDLHLPAGDIPDDLRPQVERIKHDVDGARSSFDRHMTTAGDRFEELTGRTVYAEPPPGFFEGLVDGLGAGLEFLGEFAIGIVEGVWEMVKGLYSIVALAVQPWKWDEAWATFTQILEFACNDPRAFFELVGKAIVDWDTLMESPGRWLGKLVPALVLAIVTGGAGAVASGLGRAATLASRFSRLARVAKKLDGVAGAARKLDNFANVPRRLMTSGPSSVRTALTAMDTVASMPGRAASTAFRAVTGRNSGHSPLATNVDLPSTNRNNLSTTDTSTSPGPGSDPTATGTGSDTGANPGGADVQTTHTASDTNANVGGADTSTTHATTADTSANPGGTDVQTTHTTADAGANPGGADVHTTQVSADAGVNNPVDTTARPDVSHPGTVDVSSPSATHLGGDHLFDSGTGRDPFDAPEYRPVDNPAHLLDAPEFRPDTSALDLPDHRPVHNPADLVNAPEYRPQRDPLLLGDQHQPAGGNAPGDRLDLDNAELAPAGVSAATPAAMARHVPHGPGGGGSGGVPRGPVGPGARHTPGGPGGTGGSGGSGGNGPGGGGPGGPRGPGGRGGPAGSTPPDPPRRPPPGSTPDRRGPWGDNRSRVQEWRGRWWNDHRPTHTANGGPTTVPSRNPSVNPPPVEGKPARIEPKDSPEGQRNHELENLNAPVLTEHGFRVRQNPDFGPDGRPSTADYDIEGKLFDHKVARTDNARNFFDSQFAKGVADYARKGTQADRFVVDLRYTRMTPADLRAELVRRGPESGVQEVFVIQDGDVIPIWP